MTLSSSAYKYPRRGCRKRGEPKQKGISGRKKKRKKGSQNGGTEGEKGELEGFF